MGTVKAKMIFERAFILVLCALILIWGIDIFANGLSSSQIDLFFSRTNDFMADCVNVVGYSSQLDPYNNTMYTGLAEKAYPPLPYVMAYLLSRLVNIQPYYEANNFLSMYTEHVFLLFYMFCIIFIMIMGYSLIYKGKNGKRGIKSGVALVILFSGPMLFTLERANIVLCEPFLCLAFLIFYDSENKFAREIGLISLAIAAGIKMTPAILGLLLIYERRWKEVVRTVIYGILFFVGPFLLLHGGLANLPLMFRNLGFLMQSYSGADGCSLRNMLETIGRVLNIQPTALLSTVLSYVFATLMLAYSYMTSTRWERAMALSLIILCVPNYSAYYNIIYLIPTTVFFLNEKRHKWLDLIIFFAFLIIYNPVQMAFLDYHWGMILLVTGVLVRGIMCIVRFISRGGKGLEQGDISTPAASFRRTT